jgi:hypothetical protein
VAKKRGGVAYALPSAKQCDLTSSSTLKPTDKAFGSKHKDQNGGKHLEIIKNGRNGIVARWLRLKVAL